MAKGLVTLLFDNSRVLAFFPSEIYSICILFRAVRQVVGILQRNVSSDFDQSISASDIVLSHITSLNYLGWSCKYWFGDAQNKLEGDLQ